MGVKGKAYTSTTGQGANLVYFQSNAHRIIDASGPDVIKYFEDWTSPVAASDAVPGYTVTLVEAGSGESTVTIPDALGGTLLLTTDNAEDDGITFQKTGENFKLSTAADLVYFGARFKCGEATQNDWLIGLCITDTTLLGGMSDGIYFEKLDGGTGISFTTEKNATETQADALATFAADTYITVEWAYVKADATVYAYIDGVQVASSTTNIVDDEEITPSVQLLAGSAAINTLTLDWWRAVQIGR